MPLFLNICVRIHKVLFSGSSRMLDNVSLHFFARYSIRMLYFFRYVCSAFWNWRGALRGVEPFKSFLLDCRVTLGHPFSFALGFQEKGSILEGKPKMWELIYKASFFYTFSFAIPFVSTLFILYSLLFLFSRHQLHFFWWVKGLAIESQLRDRSRPTQKVL